MTAFRIAATYDIVCPWCFIAKRNLERGIAAYQKAHPSSGDTFHVTWHPFQLNPAAPLPGVDKEEYSLQRFGDPKRLHAMHAKSTAIGKQVGIHFKEGGKTGNTRAAHRLVSLAGSKGEAVQSRVVENLFAIFHEREGDITNLAELEGAGTSAGLSASEVHALLHSNERDADVEEQIRLARRNSITGVPNFVVQDKYELQGAQDADRFRECFESIRATENSAL